MTSLPLPRILLLLALAAATPLSSCAGTSDDNSADGPRGDCPVTPLNVVASVDQWGSIATELGSDCVDVTTIVTGTAADPHDYEPSPSDLSAFGDAQIVIVNGVDYDHWPCNS